MNLEKKYEYKNLTIGSDPEIFVRDVKTKKLASIIGIINATKEEPLSIGEGCFIQEDNILAEFNIPACKTKEAFVSAMNYAKSHIELIIAPRGLELHYASSEKVNNDILKDKAAHVFGCASSYNCITEKPSNMEDLDTSKLKMRSSGFHIHFGWENPTEEQRDRLCMMFELGVSLPLILEDNDYYNRRSLYGKFGDSRDKDYGVECRSLGGYFLKDEESISNIWDRSLMAVKMAEEWDISNEDLRKDILKYLNPEKEELDLDKINILVEKYEIKKLIQKYKIKEYVNI